MKIPQQIAFSFSLLLGLAMMAGTAQAQKCSTKTTTGTYLVICNGYLPPAANAPIVPAKELATVTADQNGNFNGGGTISVGGFLLDQTVSGTEQLGADCTGSISFAQTINGQPGPPLDIKFIVSQNGDRIDGLVVDPGTVFACQLTRTSK